MGSENNALAIIKDHRDSGAMAAGLTAGYFMGPGLPSSSKLMGGGDMPPKDFAIWASQAEIASGAVNLLLAYLAPDHPKVVGTLLLINTAFQLIGLNVAGAAYRGVAGLALVMPSTTAEHKKLAATAIFALGGYHIGGGAAMRVAANKLPDPAQPAPISSTLPNQGTPV